MWFKESNRYSHKIGIFAYGVINERSFSNPHPRNAEIWCFFCCQPDYAVEQKSIHLWILAPWRSSESIVMFLLSIIYRCMELVIRAVSNCMTGKVWDEINLSIAKLQRLHRLSLGMDKWFHPTHYNGCKYLSMLGLKLNHVSKRGPWYWMQNRRLPYSTNVDILLELCNYRNLPIASRCKYIVATQYPQWWYGFYFMHERENHIFFSQ